MFSLTPLEIEALALSLRVALASVLGSLPIAVVVAWILARREFPGKLLLDGLVHLPLVIPPVAVGYILLVVFGRNGLIGDWLFNQFGITLIFSWSGAALAAAVMAFPLTVRAIRLALSYVDPRLENAARTLGAGRGRVAATITLPLALPGILTGAVLGFARALGEFGATITFVSSIPGETRTLPLALYALVQSPGGDESAGRLLVISVVVAMAALAASEILARRLRRRLGT